MIEPDELRALCQRIIQSGELGRSKTYAAILEYLAEQAISGDTPKEISIAMEVLGRTSDFDVGKDSIVRVHIYHLRNKLNTYYAKHGKAEKFLLEIPKGQYMLASTLNRPEEAEGGFKSITGKTLNRASTAPWLMTLACLLLAANILLNWDRNNVVPIVSNPYGGTMLWQPILDDALPVLILVGDYYIMGEVDERGNINRMVREFDINSQRDLVQSQQEDRNKQYMNLDLSYTPTSIPNALVQVLKVFGSDNQRVSVKLMSEFTSSDLVGGHIIYLGYLSGMESLNELVFSASGLAVGRTFDELINMDENINYTSSSGLSTGDMNYRDYGLLSTFPAPSGAQYVFLSGMRDEGLINLAQEVTMLPALSLLEEQGLEGAEGNIAFEALYEVLGFSNTNIDAKLVYSAPLDTEVLWDNRLLGAQ